MLTTTDLVISSLLLFYFIDGFRKGLFRSLVTPMAFLVSLVIGVMNFDLNQNLVKAATVTLCSTMIISIGVKLLLYFSRRTVDKTHRNYVSLISRFLGAIFSILWKGAVTGLLLLLIISLPTISAGINEIQGNIHSSRAYDFANQFLAKPHSPVWNIMAATEALKDPAQMEELSKTASVNEMLHYQKTQDMINDPAVMEAMQSGDYIQLMTNPRVVAVLDDDHLMYQITTIAKQMYSKTAGSPSP